MGGTTRRRSLLDDLGAAVAAALAPHRFLGLLLVLAAPLTALDGGEDAPTWAACVGVVAGALLRSWPLVLVATLPSIAWIVGLAVPPSSFHPPDAGLKMWVLTTFAGALGAVAGSLPRARLGRPPHWVLLVMPFIAAFARRQNGWDGFDGLGALALATVFAALFVSSGRIVIPAVLLFATSFMALVDERATRSRFDAADTAWIAVNAVLLACVAGRTHAALHEGRADGDEAAARLVVRAQISTWTTCALVGALFVYCVGVIRPGGHEEAAIGRIAGLAIGGAFLHHLARGARAGFDRLAGFVVALGACWPVSVVVFDGGPRAVALATCLLVGPQAMGRVLDAAADREPRWTLPFVAVLAVAMPDPSTTPLFLLWLTAVVAAFHLVVLSDVPARRVFVGAVVGGVASGVFREALFPTGRRVEQGAEVLALWLVAATLALAARRMRTMTAVPDDHAVRMDFDVHAEKAPA